MIEKEKMIPKRYCKLCLEKLFNRRPNAKYCKECENKATYIQHRIGAVTYQVRKIYPEIKINVSVNIKRKDD